LIKTATIYYFTIYLILLFDDPFDLLFNNPFDLLFDNPFDLLFDYLLSV